MSSLKVKCPKCRQLVDYDDQNICRPFCSKRCQELDLGAWAVGAYALPDPTPLNQTSLEDLDIDPENLH